MPVTLWQGAIGSGGGRVAAASHENNGGRYAKQGEAGTQLQWPVCNAHTFWGIVLHIFSVSLDGNGFATKKKTPDLSRDIVN